MNKALLAVIVVLIIGSGAWALFKPKVPATEPTSSTGTTTETPAPEPESEPAPTPTVYYPLPNYPPRVTERVYGTYYSKAKSGELACGGQFSGYHNGDDLEATPAEIDQEVPVFAIADGKVREFNRINGYGGLLIIEHTIAGQTMTANYGHVDLNQPKVTVGGTVKAGQVAAYLGAHCSSETDGERKHLHFSLHKGTIIDVKGYVQSQAALAEWLNPKEFLAAQKAAEPKP